MTYDYFADFSDKVQIIEFIFKETDLQLFELYSEYGKEITQYKTAEELITKLEINTEQKLHYQLWSPKHNGKPIFRKVDLNPDYCNGYTFRFNTVGWGLIQLYFGEMKANNLCKSHIGHFNENGALKHENPIGLLGSVSSWNWKEIQKSSRRLRYFIHNKLAIKKVDSIDILKGADWFIKQGGQLRK